MIEMELLERKLILNLKSQFFDVMNTDWGLMKYQDLLEKMLSIIKLLLEVDEVAFFNSNNCKRQLCLSVSTEKDFNTIAQISAITCAEFERFVLDRSVIRQPIPFSMFRNYDAVFPLRKEEEILGYLAIKGKTNYSDIVMVSIIKECASFIQKAYHFCKIIVEEKRYRRLFRVTEKFHSTMNMDAVLGEIIDTLQEEYPAFTYYLMLSHDNDSHANLPIKDLEYDSENISAMEAYVTGKIQLEDSIVEKRSILYAPLKGKQGVYGVLQVIAPNSMMFPNNEVEFITLLANTAGSALENAQLYQQSKRLISDLQLINETSHKLNSHLRLTEATSFMVKQIMDSFGAEEIGFVDVSEDFEEMKIYEGSTSFFFSEAAEFYVQYISRKLKMEREPLFIGDLRLDHYQKKVRYKSVIVVPMVEKGVIKGFAMVMHHEPYYFTFETFKLLQSLIHHSTLAFTNAILREEQEKMVITDHLTKLYSRNYLDEQIQRSMVKGNLGTFLLIDIDNFKQINDTFGHQVGDDVLIQVASIIQTNIRKTDIGARWGGEELAVYLPNVPVDKGKLIAQRIVNKVCSESKPKITISCGISYWDHETNDSFTTLFKRADLALYAAKESGKNKVVVQEKDQHMVKHS